MPNVLIDVVGVVALLAGAALVGWVRSRDMTPQEARRVLAIGGSILVGLVVAFVVTAVLARTR